MDDSNLSQPVQPVAPKSKKSKKIHVLYVIIIILCAGAAAAAGWLYYDTQRVLRDQQIRIDELQRQLDDLGGGGGETEEGIGATCGGGSAYSAAIGKFAIALSNPNVIIRTLDGNFEGGPITDLTIGQCVDGATNVVNTYPTHQVKILGHPSSNAETLRTNFEAQWGSPLTAGADVTIDGVTVHTYTGTGLFNTKLVYFDHNGVGFQLELTDANETTEAILTDVISDWSFTP